MEESAVGYRRTPCFRAEEHSERMGSSTSVDSSTSKNFPRSSAFYASMFEYNDQPHFLDSCSLCGKPLGAYSDIFMYRGDTPFCSQDCREEQIEADQVEEKRKRNINNKLKHISSGPSTSQIQDCSVRTSTVAVS